MYSSSTPSAPLALTVRRYMICHDQNAGESADKSRLNLIYKAKYLKKNRLYLSLGFLGISAPSLEKATLPRQKVLNMREGFSEWRELPRDGHSLDPQFIGDRKRVPAFTAHLCFDAK